MISARDVDVLARTVYGEARGASALGKEAVAHVVLNRWRRGGWWGNTILKVCLHKLQFSCWNDSDPNREKLMVVDLGDSLFRECHYAALAAIRDEDNDPTRGAFHYHTYAVSPAWAKDKPYLSIGHHRFVTDVD